MEIHELNTKALTDPGYAAVDDGTDTYKVDLHNLLSTNLASAETYADSAVAAESAVLQESISENATAIDALERGPKIWYGQTSTAAATEIKTFGISNFNPKDGDLFIAEFVYGNTSSTMKFAVNNLTVFQNVFFGLPSDAPIPNLRKDSYLMFTMYNSSLTSNPRWNYDFVGFYPPTYNGGVA